MICATWIKEHAKTTAAWLDDFDAMLSFAQSRGWLADDGQSIKAHIERSASPAG
jgi:hypothetical protein